VTVAFGIGIDISNIRRVIHIGVPHTIEEFFQEAGRCGRDGLPASSTLYFNNHDISPLRNISRGMIEYVTSAVCKRGKVLSYFGYSIPARDNVPDHLCCDYHVGECKCDDCVIETASEMFEQCSCSEEKDIYSQEELHTFGSDTEASFQLSDEKKQHLRHKLTDFRQTLHGYGRSCVGSVSLTTGFSMELIDNVIEHANELTSLEKVKSKLLLFNNDHAVAIFEIVKELSKI
jgi:superfamily II DNA helicase RecQ